jgi:nitric oxide reductase subunit B
MISTPLKALFLFSIFGAMAITLAGGWVTYEAAPPYPDRFIAPDGQQLSDREALFRGQNVWQRYGLMNLGSVWGHGTYRGNDYSATTLNLVGRHLRDFHSRRLHNSDYADLDLDRQASIDRMVIQEIKQNRYDPDTGTLTMTEGQVSALNEMRSHWDKVFGDGDKRTVVLPSTVTGADERKDLADFFYWTAWAAGTLRPDKDLTYTNNWPPDRSVGNELAPAAFVWTIVSLLGFIVALGGALVLFFKGGFDKDDSALVLDKRVGNKLINLPISSSQRKTAKYFVVVMALFVLQLMMGGLMAHFTVHPGEFYGILAVSDNIPYNLPKTWHLQLAIFWVATAWVAGAMYLAPIAGKHEPRKQGMLVDILFVAIVAVAVGALAGTAYGIKTGGGSAWFWLAHQGWEYLEMGRMWQILLFGGLIGWLVIVGRAVKGSLARGQDRWDAVPFFTFAAIAIVSFFAFGLLYDPSTHLTIADFWRWWVVHTWVEGIFEFFAAAAIAYVVITLGLAPRRKAMRAAYLTASLALFSGIIGVGHHYYWFGDPDLWLSLGGVISTMEPVPIILLLMKVAIDSRNSPVTAEAYPYKWPLMFLGASALWAFLGAGVFGFLITTPAVNYYEHSTYLTMNHGHTAFFGTYGMLAIGLMLFAFRGIIEPAKWNTKLLKIGFWGTNGGLFLMAIFTLLPVGFMQVWDSYQNGLWHARSPAFYEQDIVMFIGQWRLVPDLIIIVGALALLTFAAKAMFSLKKATIADGAAVVIPDPTATPAQ